jgi:transcriptional regulator with GAF, ATPase, and Fis domain
VSLDLIDRLAMKQRSARAETSPARRAAIPPTLLESEIFGHEK